VSAVPAATAVRATLPLAGDVSGALRSAPLFEGIPPQDIEQIASRMVRRRFSRGDVILSQGGAPGAMHVITRGSVKITISSDDGKEMILAILHPGELFGEIAALDGGARSATVTAIEPTETAALSRSDLLEFVQTHPDFALRLIATLAKRLRLVDERLEDAHFLDLDARMAKILLDLTDQGQILADGSVRISLTQSELASMIGATRVSANRLLKTFESAGLVRRGRSAITVTDMRGLRHRAGR
jgi:CRP/FNR family cyclic AMP-dependent transcriptional regulator